jgi:hypothetical protein
MEITIFDASGNKVETVTHSGASKALSLGAALKPGIYIYLVQVKGVKGSKSFRIVKE